MAAGAGYYDANGVWQYGETDAVALFSDTMNKGMTSVSSAITSDRSRLTALEAAPAPGLIPLVPSSVTVGSGSSSIGSRGKVTLTSVGTSFSLNSVFTATYEYYKVVLTGTVASAAALNLRFRNGTTDKSSSLYDWAALVADATGPRQARNSAQANITMSLNVGTSHSSELIFYNPFATTSRTTVTANTFSWATGSANTIGVSGLYSTAGRDDGFTILTGAAFTGTVQVYGFN